MQDYHASEAYTVVLMDPDQPMGKQAFAIACTKSGCSNTQRITWKPGLNPDLVNNKFKSTGWFVKPGRSVCPSCMKKHKGRKPKGYDPAAASRLEKELKEQEVAASFVLTRESMKMAFTEAQGKWSFYSEDCALHFDDNGEPHIGRLAFKATSKMSLSVLAGKTEAFKALCGYNVSVDLLTTTRVHTTGQGETIIRPMILMVITFQDKL